MIEKDTEYIVNGRKSKYNNLEDIISDIDKGKIPVVKDAYLSGDDDVYINESTKIYEGGKIKSETNNYYYITPKKEVELSPEDINLIKEKINSLVELNCDIHSMYLIKEKEELVKSYIKKHSGNIVNNVKDFYYTVTDYVPCHNINFKVNIEGIGVTISIRGESLVINDRVYGRNVHHRRTIKLNNFQMKEYLKKKDFLLNK